MQGTALCSLHPTCNALSTGSSLTSRHTPRALPSEKGQLFGVKAELTSNLLRCTCVISPASSTQLKGVHWANGGWCWRTGGNRHPPKGTRCCVMGVSAMDVAGHQLLNAPQTDGGQCQIPPVGTNTVGLGLRFPPRVQCRPSARSTKGEILHLICPQGAVAPLSGFLSRVLLTVRLPDILIHKRLPTGYRFKNVLIPRRPAKVHCQA
jgi:hypothetical protein